MNYNYEARLYYNYYTTARKKRFVNFLPRHLVSWGFPKATGISSCARDKPFSQKRVWELGQQDCCECSPLAAHCFITTSLQLGFSFLFCVLQIQNRNIYWTFLHYYLWFYIYLLDDITAVCSKGLIPDPSFFSLPSSVCWLLSVIPAIVAIPLTLWLFLSTIYFKTRNLHLRLLTPISFLCFPFRKCLGYTGAFSYMMPVFCKKPNFLEFRPWFYGPSAVFRQRIYSGQPLRFTTYAPTLQCSRRSRQKR